ncbi:phage portal protein [Pseudoclavibacter sp. CFCC 13611]|uniref:phage portal protein n=1 Tax=Pseudoclavibacter sp. CFCC 13611 TaxID=2615178 RepID=UPI0013013920|nr:phage portal protein [Pseudoclavibacter sp. CFCC 13611]KAB1662826.1 phage portal protein [Pseudoclavibacter sp. CFCC 13611]
MVTTLEKLREKLQAAQGGLAQLDMYYAGRQPQAFLSPDSKAALGNRLRTLGVNFPKLAVTSIAERLQVAGFQAFGSDEADKDLWRVWQANDLEEQAHLAHVDALTYGRSYVIVWVDDAGDPLVTVESPQQVTAIHDPATGRLQAALKLWKEDDGVTTNAVLYAADTITRLRGKEYSLQVVERIPNPLGEPPVVQITNKTRLLDLEGVSEMADILDLADALNKIMSDSMVSSEYFARPRRWVTGLEIAEDEDGNPINPFSNEQNRVWQSESPDTKFGQFDPASLSSYTQLVATITQQIGAISGLPPHYLGLNGDQPPSADSIRSAEASLVAKVIGRQRTFGRSWAKVADLIRKVQGAAVVDYETIWAAPDTRTPAQVADAAAKLQGIGVPLEAVLADPMGYTPSQIEKIHQARLAEAALTQPTTPDDERNAA